jgi:hypothetical protein
MEPRRAPPRNAEGPQAAFVWHESCGAWREACRPARTFQRIVLAGISARPVSASPGFALEGTKGFKKMPCAST